jgi:hypothetical protein
MTDSAEMPALQLRPDEDPTMALERDRRTVGPVDGPQQERVVAVIKDGEGEPQEVDIAADRVEVVESPDGTDEQLVRDIIGGLLEGET